jgi:flagellin-like hook-associated protein FlgL
MPLTVSNNSAVAAASHYLGKNQQALQLSIKKLASGSRLIGNPDPGTLSVSMKLNAAVTRLVGAKNNVQNGMSFVEVQDGMLETTGRIVNRMSELKGMATQDPMKSDQDVASYDNEFRDLQVQLYQISQQTFNGSSLFANHITKDADPTVAANEALFGGATQSAQLDHTISIFTSSNGSSGTKISIHKSVLLSALTINANTLASAQWSTGDNTQAAGATGVFTFAASIAGDAMTLDKVSSGVFEQALGNIAFLRAQNVAECPGLPSPPIPLQRWRRTSGPQWAGSRTWTSPRRARTWRSTAY